MKLDKKIVCLMLILSLGTVIKAQSEPSTNVISEQSSSTPTAPTRTENSTTTEATSSPETITTSQPTNATSTATPTTTETPPTTTTRRSTTTGTTSISSTTHRSTTTGPTTTRPTTTTLPPVVPNVPPFPKNVGTWSVQGVKSACILLKGAIQLNVNTTNGTAELTTDVPQSLDNVKVSGNCGSDEQTLVINWWSNTTTPDHSERNNTLLLKFTKQADEQYGLESATYHYAHGKQVKIVGPFFLTTLKHSFLCQSRQRVQNENKDWYMLTQDLQFEAFREDDEEIQGEPKFSAAYECKADNAKSTGVVLGIAVGIGLLVVVVISLGIYLFKRYRRGGYQQLET